MSDWLEPLWNFFSPKGALQKQLVDGNPSTPTYSAFGRYAKTHKYQTKFPQSSEPTNVGIFQPKQELGLTQLQLDAINAQQLQQNDPRTQNNTAVAWDLQNMNVQPTSPTNSSSSGFLVAIGMLFVGLIILSLFTKKRK
jgi:LPXTG-motif cell wall-anchored protein